jgi:sulfatase maturation enzyme AslB (radical SAM superfamily)
MIKFDDIRRVHLEISSLCNASCPWCPRTFWGYPYNGGYPEVNLTLESVKKIFSLDFLQQLKSIHINGNFGDLVTNPESPDIVEYFFSCNDKLDIIISTNGAAQSAKFWERLGKTKAKILFCIDGLIDTHHLYRQNTVWNTVINNAKIVINSGGHAEWKFIEFDHNTHQINDCRKLSLDLGFKKFNLIKSQRTVAPVFNNRGKFTHALGNYQGDTNFEVMFFKKKTDLILLEDILTGKNPKKSLNCESKLEREIYIASNGDVSPCCYTGFYPKTYGHGQYHQAANAQLISLISKNNALEYSLEECIEWFTKVKNSWSIEKYENGRLVICDDNCGI